jgi:hypothetical protein
MPERQPRSPHAGNSGSPALPTRFALPREFWERFTTEYWERRVTVISRPFPTPLAEPARTFAGVVDASDRWRAGARDDSLRFFIEQTQLLADVGRFLPERADGSASGYAQRVTRMLGGRRFGLVVEEYQAFDATLWLRLRDFLRGLYDVTGMPAEAAKATLFLGNYAATPWGLHVGRSGNFQFVVEGPKRIRTWPDAYWRDREDMSYRLDYQRYEADSTLLEGRAGDVLYWPHDTWHVGEGVGGQLSVAISVALFAHDDGGAADLLGRVGSSVRRRLAEAAEAVAVRPADVRAGLPAMAISVRRATDALRAAPDDQGLERALLAARLNHVTGYGFGVLPARLPDAALDDDAVVRGTSEYPILSLPDGGDLVCSANGRAFTATASPHVVSLLDRLNAGAPHRVETLLEEHSGAVTADGITYETSAETIRGLLEKLVALRAIVVES